MNLAAFKFRNCLAVDGGPIAKIETVQLSSPVLNGVYEAYAELRSELKGSTLPHTAVLYGTADGSGTSIFSNQARYKAISEALERWAFYEIAIAKNSSDFGFSIDRSTSGMAAFPGVFARSARKNAYLEAVERWSLGAWWAGFMNAQAISNSASSWQGIEICSSSLFSEKAVVVLLWLQTEAGVCYGFSSAETRVQAIARASIELDRNRRVLGDLPKGEVTELGEQRLLHFSLPAGHAEFLERVSSSCRLKVRASPPKLLTDTYLSGPWSAYCHVWRCLFEPVNDRHADERLDTFLF